MGKVAKAAGAHALETALTKKMTEYARLFLIRISQFSRSVSRLIVIQTKELSSVRTPLSSDF